MFTNMSDKTSYIISDETHSKYIHFNESDHNSDLDIVQVGSHDCASRSLVVPCIRDHYLLHFVHSGVGKLYLQDQTFEIPTHSCFLIHPYEISYYSSSKAETWGYYWIGITGKSARFLLDSIGYSNGNRVLTYNSSSFINTLESLRLSVFSNRNDKLALSLLSNGILRSLLFEMIDKNRKGRYHFVASISSDNRKLLGGGQYYDKYVSAVSFIIQNNYQDDLCIEKIAQMLGLNRSYLSDLFKKHTGLSIKHYLLNHRIQCACSYLRCSNSSIADISYNVGFKDSLYFSKVFKSQTNQTPSQYRKEWLSSNSD